MTWFGWLVIALNAVRAAGCILLIGKPRKPLTALDAFLIQLAAAALILGYMVVGTGSLR